MSFEILSISGETQRLHANSSQLSPAPSGDSFVDGHGHRYSATFDGSHVIFSEGTGAAIGQWLQGTAATTIRNPTGMLQGFTFTFMDHGRPPQKLHAVWRFEGSMEQAIAGWKTAGFSVSHIDRYINRNHPQAIHLRTRGAFATGAGSSHAIIPLAQTEDCTTGDIHVGEFNPLTGCGIGFVLHHLENWICKPARQSPSGVCN